MEHVSRGLASLATALPSLIRSLAALAGAGGIAYGAWLWSEPLGYVIGGTLVLAGALLDAIGSKRT
jgi:hypothetical protein